MVKRQGQAEVPASRRRLFLLAGSGLVCTCASVYCAILLLSATAAFITIIFFFFSVLFLLWGGTALRVALSQSHNAYRIDKNGLYFGNQDSPAFTWDQVAGATVVRGKRRSHITVVLTQGEHLERKGLLPDWLATFIGRPADRDLALTNMDTTLDFATFLDLISPYFHTYGNQEISER